MTVESEQGPIRTKTTWTLLLYLTSQAEGCQGGETVFFPNDRRVSKEEIRVPPETGMVLLHKHGNDCLLVGEEDMSPLLCLASPARHPRNEITDVFTCPARGKGGGFRREVGHPE